MAAVPNNGLITAAITMNGIATAGGSTSKNFAFTFNYRRTSVVNIPSETALETIFQSGVALAILNCLNNRFTQTYTDVRFVEDAERAAVRVNETQPGTVAGDSMAMHMSAFVLMRQGSRGRGRRGSKHFGPLSESDTTAGSSDVFNAGAITLWTAARTAMFTPLTDANGNVWNPCILSRRKPAQYRFNPTTVITSDVTQILLNKRIGRMKRREVASVY